jgi:Nicotinate phosphoribosyltransferase (NAPRTase) N-terminal domain
MNHSIAPPLTSSISANSISSLSSLDYSLLTDLYQLTMTACYVGESLDRSAASFELFIRKLPKGFGYSIAMGLAQVLEYLEQLQFSPAQIVECVGCTQTRLSTEWDNGTFISDGNKCDRR